MNCPQCQEQLVEYLEGTLEDATQVEAHLRQCASCRAEFDTLQNLCGSLKNTFQPAQKATLDGAVMNRIVTEQAAQLRRLKMRKRIQLFGAGAAAVAAAACFILFVLPGATPDQRALAAEALAKGAEETKGLKSVHLKCRMRTLPQDNFSLIGETYDFAGVEIWRQFGDPAKYRIEKPGRVLVCDGKATVMLMKPNTAVKGPAGANFDAGWLRDLAATDRVLSEQLRESFAGNGDMSLKNETIEGKPKQVVSVEIKATDVGDYMRNQFLMTSDTRRVFQFDAATKRLEQMRIILHAKAQDVLVFEATVIDYDPELPASLFALELPEDVAWLDEKPAPLPDNAKYSGMTPKQVAETFFNACAKEDWDEAEKFFPGKMDKRVREFLGGLKVVSLGEAFQSKPYRGWFVPYEFILKSGETRKFNLAVRKDNPAKRWTVDGGI